MKIKKLDAIFTDYLAALNNEIAIDNRSFSMLNTSPEQLGHLPRVPHWIALAKRFPRLVYSVAYILRLVWIAGGAALYFALQAVFVLTRVVRQKDAPANRLHASYALALSPRTVEIEASEPRESAITWITFPWVAITSRLENATRVEYSELLSVSDVFRSYFHAVKSVYILASRPRQGKWVLQSYTAFRWFSVRAVIDKIDGPVLMTEHYDRWAVLVDSSIWRRGAAAHRRFKLIQHGLVGSIAASAGDAAPGIGYPRKLRAVTDLRVYDAISEKIFCQNILGRRCARRAVISYLKVAVKMVQLDEFKGLRILFVGHPLCEPSQEFLFERLRSDESIKIYYKPHPRAEMSPRLRKLSWTVLNEDNVFPLVDLLVSYPSTLTMEYANAGVSSLIHPINIGAGELNDFYTLLVREIEDKKGMLQETLLVQRHH